MRRRWIEQWNPEDEEFWEHRGRGIARRNLAFSIFAEFLGFAVWVMWSVTAAHLNEAGFRLSTGQLFTLVAVPALVGATARFPYTFAVARFGGRNWTVVSALLLLVPALSLAAMVSRPSVPYWALLLVASTAGFGGGNFASSMANISFFYPDKRKGLALGLNAAGGNLGVAVAQLVIPAVIGIEALAVLGGRDRDGGLFLQNAGLVWIPFILLAAACAWAFMDNLKVSRFRVREQAVIARRKQTWVMSWLYVGTFGSFIGYSVGLPLLTKTQFPDAGLSIAFLGPLVGSLSRPFGGWLADRLGGARVTFAVFAAMSGCVAAVAFFLERKAEPYAFTGFLVAFVVLLMLTGIGNGSTYRMIPIIFRATHLGMLGSTHGGDKERALTTARRETAAALGFIGAIGAYGGWLIPQGYGISESIVGGPAGAFYGFIAFYLTCLVMIWWYYLRRRFAMSRSPSLVHASV